jgi:hypothetical protein
MRDHPTSSASLGLLAAVLLAGCAAGGPHPATAPADTEDIPILLQKSGSYARIARVVHVVARDRETLARLPITDVPVDFDTQMVLIIGLGPTPTDDIGVRIARVWRQGSRIRVQEHRIHPGAERAVGAEPASPWTIAVIPKSDLNVEGFLTRVPAGVLGDNPGAR